MGAELVLLELVAVLEEAVVDELELEDFVADDDELPAWLPLEELVSVPVLVAVGFDVVVPLPLFGAPAPPEFSTAIELVDDDVDAFAALGLDVVVLVLPFGAPALPELLTDAELVVDEVDSEVSVPPCELAVEVSLLPQASAAPAPIAMERADRLENFMRPPDLATIERSRAAPMQCLRIGVENGPLWTRKSRRVTRRPTSGCKHSMADESWGRTRRSSLQFVGAVEAIGLVAPMNRSPIR
jgi:hypothetical protein